MEYVAPFAVFLFFLAVIALRAGRDGEGVSERLAAWRGARHEPARLPAQGQGAERFVRYGGYGAWGVGLVGLVGAGLDDRLLALLLPAGLTFAAIGVVVATDHRGVLARLRARHERSFSYALTRTSNVSRWSGVGLASIGLVFAAFGVAALLSALS